MKRPKRVGLPDPGLVVRLGLSVAGLLVAVPEVVAIWHTDRSVRVKVRLSRAAIDHASLHVVHDHATMAGLRYLIAQK